LTRRRTLGLLLLLLLPAPSVLAQQPSLAVRVEGGRATVTIGPVLGDATLEEAARAGLPIRLRVRVELWRSAFFDQLVMQEHWGAVVLFDPLADRFSVGSPGSGAARGVADWGEARSLLERTYGIASTPSTPGRYYYTTVLEVETLSLSDLEELQRWLRGELQPAVSGEGSLPVAVGTGLRRLFVRLLRLPARRYEARSPVFAAQAG
jgi:hypothetical protein